MKLKRTLSLVTASLVLTSALTACGESTQTAETATPETTDAVTSALDLVGVPADLVLETTGVAGDAVVMTVDGVDVTADMLFYWTVATCDQYIQMGVTDWEMDIGGMTIGEMVLQGAQETAIYHQVVTSKAQELGCTMTEADWADFDTRVEALKANMATDPEEAEMGYQYWLAYMGITEAAFLDMSQTSYALLNLEEDLFGENGTQAVSQADIEAWVADAGIVNTKHILVMNQPSEDGSDDGSAAALAAAQAIRDQLTQEGDTAEAFDTLMYEKTEDMDYYGTPNNPEGYTFDATGTMVDGGGSLVTSFVEAGQALEIGEISDPVQSEYGYHILMRTEVDMDSMMAYYVDDAMNILTEEWFSSAQVETTEDFDAVCSIEAYTTFNDVVRVAIMEGMDEMMPQEEVTTEGE